MAAEVEVEAAQEPETAVEVEMEAEAAQEPETAVEVEAAQAPEQEVVQRIRQR